MTGIGPAPLARLREWLPPNDAEDRPRIQVATVDAEGRPDIRTVLLSAWDEDGFEFHTDAASRKAADLAGDPAVAIAVLWPGFTRQLVVRGKAEVAERDRLDRAFARRSAYLQQLAWQNTAELAQQGRAQRIEAWARFAAEHDPSTLGVAPGWTGYLVRPDRITFWESDAEGPSHRIEFRREHDSTWSEHHLPG